MKRPRFPKVLPTYYPLGGGLDLLTPAIAMPAGKVISSQNYEPEIAGGYRRIDGFERYDGQAAPSSKSYWIAAVTLTATVKVGDTITGLTSAVTANVLFQVAGFLILGAVSGTYTSGETISNGGNVGTIGLVQLANAQLPSDHADYTNLAASVQRAVIGKVPGSGPIRGVWYYGLTLYAFRDNAGATAGNMYKATAGGWVQVAFGTELQFSSALGGTTPISAGQTIGNLGAAPTKTATVVAVLTRSGTWGTDAAGTIIITPLTGVWANGEAIFVGATQKAVSTTAATAITRLPGGPIVNNKMPGQLEFVNDNFTGSTATQKMYGADGVNLAFEFDGTNYIPIRTGMVVDTPTHVIVHKHYLILSFRGSVQISGLGNPYAWTVVLGAAEIGTGEAITGFLIQTGNYYIGASMAVLTAGQTYILYGSSTLDFKLTPSVYTIGSYAFSSKMIGNDAMMLTNRGIQRMTTTLNFGDFQYASVSHLIQTLITSKRGLQTCSTVLKTKNQYRVYFNDNSALTVGLTGDTISGIMVLDYGIAVRVICTDSDSTGAEVTWFGSDDGYVYQDNMGTSQDGANITSWLRLPFNNMKTPRMMKRFRSVFLELVVVGFAKVDVTYDLGYGNLDVAQGIAVLGTQLLASGGYWDQFTWDQFTWDAQAVGNPRISLDGTETNISMLFYSSRNQDNSHTLQGITFNFTPTNRDT